MLTAGFGLGSARWQIYPIHRFTGRSLKIQKFNRGHKLLVFKMVEKLFSLLAEPRKKIFWSNRKKPKFGYPEIGQPICWELKTKRLLTPKR